MPDKIKEGNVAQRILNDDVFQKAVDMADEMFVDEWRRAETTEERERAHAKQAALVEVQDQLSAIMDRGEVEKHQQD